MSIADSTKPLKPAASSGRGGIICTSVRGAVILAPTGPIGLADTARLRHRLDDLLRRPCAHVVVNLGRVTSADGAALHLLDRMQRRAVDQGGWLRLAKPHPNLNRHLHIAGLTTYPSITAALYDGALYPQWLAGRTGTGRLEASG